MPIKIVPRKAGPKGYSKKPSKKPVKKLAKGDELSLKRRRRMMNPTVRGAGFGNINLRDKLRLLEAMEAAGMDMQGLKKGGGKVKTTTARGMGAATRGGQFRKNG